MGLSIKVLGEFEVRASTGEQLKLPTRKTRALLAFLVVNADKPQRRERLMGLLWSNRSEQQARHSLNQALLCVRKLTADDDRSLLAGDSDHVTLCSEAISSDLASFRELLADEPTRAVELYSGPLLDGLMVPDPEFEEWLRGARAELQETVCDALRRAAESAEELGTTDRAIEFTRQLLELDPLHEGVHRRLIRLLYESGDRSGALRQYRACVDVLKKELEIEPDAGTKGLVDQIRRACVRPNEIEARDTGQEREVPASLDIDPLLSEVAAGESASVVVLPTPVPPGGREQRLTGGFFPPPPSGDGRPSIAVLPFRNSSGEPEQAFFCDAISEDLIFSLSSFRWLAVLGRGSSFRYRELDLDPRRIGAHLNARYVLDGSVRRQRSQLRIGVALVDSETGAQLWTQQYDRKVDDLFDIHDQIVQQVVACVEIRLDNIEMQRALAKPAANLGAYEFVKRGYWHIYNGGAEALAEGTRNFDRAVDLDPSYAPAHAGRAYCELLLAFADFTDIRYDHLRASAENARHALALEPDDPRSLRYFGQASGYLGRPHEALDAASRAVELCPSYGSGYSGLAFSLDLVGRFEEAIPAADRTVRLAPYDPILHRCIMSKSIAHYQRQDYEAAETVARYSLAVADWSLSHLMLLAILGQSGTRESAGEQARKMKRLFPEATLERMTAALPFSEAAHREHIAEGMARAGWKDPP